MAYGLESIVKGLVLSVKGLGVRVKGDGLKASCLIIKLWIKV
jgi:hypothetical protein